MEKQEPKDFELIFLPDGKESKLIEQTVYYTSGNFFNRIKRKYIIVSQNEGYIEIKSIDKFPEVKKLNLFNALESGSIEFENKEIMKILKEEKELFKMLKAKSIKQEQNEKTKIPDNCPREGSGKPIIGSDIPYLSDGAIEQSFKNWLIRAGYKEYTNSGRPSTVYEYLKSIDFVYGIEGISLKTLGENIHYYLAMYDHGSKSHLGEISHRTVINALKRFDEFLRY